jgi:hypothetical protein
MTENSEKIREMNPHIHEAGEHIKVARDNMRKSFEALLPPGYVEHRKAAHKEFLLAMRSLVEAAIDRLETRSAK